MSVVLNLMALTFKFPVARDKLSHATETSRLALHVEMYYKQISNFNICNMNVHLNTRHKPQTQDGDGRDVTCFVLL